MKFEWDERKNRRNKKKLAKNTEEFDRRFDGGERARSWTLGYHKTSEGTKVGPSGPTGRAIQTILFI
jgi:hypothetical protein